MNEEKKIDGAEPARKKPGCRREDEAGLFIPAGLFLGLGAGFLLEHTVAGMCLGLGFGFLAMGIAKLVLRGRRD